MLENPLFLYFVPSTGELLIMGAIVILLFGGTFIPKLMRGIGEGIRELRTSMSPTATGKGKEAVSSTTKAE